MDAKQDEERALSAEERRDAIRRLNQPRDAIPAVELPVSARHDFAGPGREDERVAPRDAAAAEIAGEWYIVCSCGRCGDEHVFNEAEMGEWKRRRWFVCRSLAAPAEEDPDEVTRCDAANEWDDLIRAVRPETLVHGGGRA